MVIPTSASLAVHHSSDHLQPILELVAAACPKEECFMIACQWTLTCLSWEHEMLR